MILKSIRNENKLYIRYGILKKVNYTIPAEKISALKLKQTFFARLTGRYTAEIINIGMGDDAAETQSFFLPYCKRNQMEERIRLLLPEFYEAVQMQTVRQPIATWIAWIWPAVLFALFLVAGALLSVYYFPEFQKEIILGVLIFSIWMILLVLAYFLTAGSTVGVSPYGDCKWIFWKNNLLHILQRYSICRIFTKHICQSGEASKKERFICLHRLQTGNRRFHISRWKTERQSKNGF